MSLEAVQDGNYDGIEKIIEKTKDNILQISTWCPHEGLIETQGGRLKEVVVKCIPCGTEIPGSYDECRYCRAQTEVIPVKERLSVFLWSDDRWESLEVAISYFDSRAKALKELSSDGWRLAEHTDGYLYLERSLDSEGEQVHDIIREAES